MPLILPSLLAANTLNLGDEIQAVLDAGADGIHLDIMDNHFVPNLSFGPQFAVDIKKQFPDVLLDVHLMVTPVSSAVEAFIQAGASRISFHPEATHHTEDNLKKIKDQGVKAGLAINPDTSFQIIHDYLPLLDFVLVMTVHPGFGNQAFMPEVLPKIEALAKAYPSLPIEVDGGVSADNARELFKHGATQFVMGSAIFKSKSYQKTITSVRNQIGV